ncbi:Histidyl-tRNA synthetase, partial [hydrothermal vent metagenome]
MTDAKPSKPRKIKAPRGTRDLYPAEAARRRWLMERWREVSIRHGFEEVDGPTYEEADLYAVKSGEGILGELFQAFSGKSPEEVERVKRDGRAGYALRPEFTPTLARMYAAKANTLPKPCKWFMAGPFFRAERPQRGRLREFLQWNVDVLGLDVPQEKWYAEDAESRAEVAEAKARMDAECIACVAVFCEQLGFTPEGDVRIHISDRSLIMSMLHASGVTNDDMEKALALLDRRNKLDQDAFVTDAEVLGLNIRAFDELLAQVQIDFAARVDRAHLQHIKHTIHVTPKLVSELLTEAGEITEQDIVQTASESDRGEKEVVSSTSLDYRSLYSLCDHLGALGLREWVTFDPAIVRGLAYYTGTVFEVIADGERAVAGGGRYDNLIELFGGPPTPAV